MKALKVEEESKPVDDDSNNNIINNPYHHNESQTTWITKTNSDIKLDDKDLHTPICDFMMV